MPLDIAKGNKKNFTVFMAPLLNPNMTLYLDNYTALLTPENMVYGVQPTDTTLVNAILCTCGTPNYACRKQLRYYVTYSKGEKNGHGHILRNDDPSNDIS